MEIITPEEALKELVLPKCNECRHFDAQGDCPAWPGGVPDDIAFNEVEHDHVFPGQVGKYVFTPRS
ncbi:MAG: hypothetical protein Q8O35_13415 [Humidesulfovibrio sp.]|jgi:hypothetical protein|nr:hypothetical protein [Humidesulfovibrio sp.]